MNFNLNNISKRGFKLDRNAIMLPLSLILVMGGAVATVMAGNETVSQAAQHDDPTPPTAPMTSDENGSSAAAPAHAASANEGDVKLASSTDAAKAPTLGEKSGDAYAAVANATNPAAPANSSHSSANPAADAPLNPTLKEKIAAGCLADQSSIEDLRKRREELETRVKEMESREAELKAKEVALTEEMKKLAQFRDEIAKTDGTRKKENEEKVAKIVETIETMSPKAAAKLVETLDESLAVVAISRIDTKKLAKIMNLMEPRRTSRLTELLAGVVRANPSKQKTTSPGVAVATNQEKGGDANVGQNDQPSTGQSTGAGTERKPANGQF